jgi:hypothetical protein
VLAAATNEPDAATATNSSIPSQLFIDCTAVETINFFPVDYTTASSLPAQKREAAIFDQTPGCGACRGLSPHMVQSVAL